MKKYTMAMTAAAIAAGLMVTVPAQLQTEAQAESAASQTSAAIPAQENVNLRIRQLEQALQPETAKEAIELFVKSHETRNGALLYAILTSELQRSQLATFVEQNWVLGVSSPWAKGYRVTRLDEKSSTAVDYTLELLEYTSTGFMGTEEVKVSLKKEDQVWHVADYKPVEFSADMDLMGEKLTEKTALGLITEAQKRFWYVMSGGYNTGKTATFRPDSESTVYRYLSEDIGTREKLTRFLEDVYSKAAVASYLEQQFKQKSLIDGGDDGSGLAQPDADGGSLLDWGQAKIIKLEQNGNKATMLAKVPVGENGTEELSVSYTYEENAGWRIASSIPEAH